MIMEEKMTFRNQYIEELFQEITEFRIVKGKISSDPTFYEFEIEKVALKGKVTKDIIRVCAEKADTPKEFRKQFQKLRYYPTVRFTNIEWDEFLQASVSCMKLIEAPEESDSVFKAREIFAKIRQFEPTTIVEDVISGKALYNHNDYYYFPSWKVKEIVDTYHFQIPFNILSTAMTELGLKKPGTEVIRLGGNPTRCWAFITSEVNF